jgi:hypothetical protein
MAIATRCQTPGAVFHSEITGRRVAVAVDLPQVMRLSEEAAKMLDANLHNAVELALAPYFTAIREEGP